MARLRRVEPPSLAELGPMTPADAEWAFRQLCRSFLRAAGGGDPLYRRVRDFTADLDERDPLARLAALQTFLAEIGELDAAEDFAARRGIDRGDHPHPFDNYVRLDEKE